MFHQPQRKAAEGLTGLRSFSAAIIRGNDLSRADQEKGCWPNARQSPERTWEDLETGGVPRRGKHV